MADKSWWDLLMGRGALKKAAATGDAPKPASTPAQPVPNYVEQEIARQKKPSAAEPAPDDKKKKQPRIGFRPDPDDNF